MSTPDLFSDTPAKPPESTQEHEERHVRRLYRTTDPETSREAAGAIADKLGYQQSRILGIVEVHPGMTSREIGRMFHEHWGGDSEAAHKRLVELERANEAMVRRGEPRTCTVTGRSAATWYATTEYA